MADRAGLLQGRAGLLPPRRLHAGSARRTARDRGAGRRRLAGHAHLRIGLGFLERQRGGRFVQFHERLLLPSQAGGLPAAQRVRPHRRRQCGRLAHHLRGTGTLVHAGGTGGGDLGAGREASLPRAALHPRLSPSAPGREHHQPVDRRRLRTAGLARPAHPARHPVPARAWPQQLFLFHLLRQLWLQHRRQEFRPRRPARPGRDHRSLPHQAPRQGHAPDLRCAGQGGGGRVCRPGRKPATCWRKDLRRCLSGHRDRPPAVVLTGAETPAWPG